MSFRSFWFDVKSFCLGILLRVLESMLATQLFRYRASLFQEDAFAAVFWRLLCTGSTVGRWVVREVTLCLHVESRFAVIVLIAWQRNPQQMMT